MKPRSKPFDQFLIHDSEDVEKADELMSQSLLEVGGIVLHFNMLENLLDRHLCETISDRSDEPGLIVIARLAYKAKVNLFERFCDSLHANTGVTLPGYADMSKKLSDAGDLRNLVVHANWAFTDHEGYTFTNARISKGTITQEYRLLTAKSLEKITNELLAAHYALDHYWMQRQHLLASI